MGSWRTAPRDAARTEWEIPTRRGVSIRLGDAFRPCVPALPAVFRHLLQPWFSPLVALLVLRLESKGCKPRARLRSISKRTNILILRDEYGATNMARRIWRDECGAVA